MCRGMPQAVTAQPKPDGEGGGGGGGVTRRRLAMPAAQNSQQNENGRNGVVSQLKDSRQTSRTVSNNTGETFVLPVAVLQLGGGIALANATHSCRLCS